MGQRRAEGENQEVRRCSTSWVCCPRASIRRYHLSAKELLGVVISDSEPVAGCLQGLTGLC